MIKKSQVSNFIKELRSKSNIKFYWLDKSDNKGKFTIQNSNRKKSFAGIFEIDDKKVKTKVLNNKNYNDKYIRSYLRNIFENGGGNRRSLIFEDYYPRIGDIITTKYLIDQLRGGEELKLPPGTFYYSINDDYLDCNGWPLEEPFVGKYEEQVFRKCENNSFDPLPHTIFRLIHKY